MKPETNEPDDESEPSPNTRRYLECVNLVVRFTLNVVKLVLMLSG